jgi:hypothetical protein
MSRPFGEDVLGGSAHAWKKNRALPPPTFTAGELHALDSGNTGGAFIRLLFTGCGVEPIVTLVDQPAN